MHFYAKVINIGYGRTWAAWVGDVLERVFCIVAGPNVERLFCKQLFCKQLFYKQLFYKQLFYKQLFYKQLFYVVGIVQPNSCKKVLAIRRNESKIDSG